MECLPVAAAEVPEAQRLLRWQVDHDEAIGSGLLRILQHLLLAVTEQRVVVSHKENWCLQPPLPRVADHLENMADRDAVLEGLLYTYGVRKGFQGIVANESTYSVGGLNCWAVGNGVGEGHAEFNNV